MLGIGHPVYGFDAPGIVERLIERAARRQRQGDIYIQNRR